MTSAAIECCTVCRKAILPGLIDCSHSPEEWAQASVSQIMEVHGPALREALRGFFAAAREHSSPRQVVQPIRDQAKKDLPHV
jgi:hypothetical protein